MIPQYQILADKKRIKLILTNSAQAIYVNGTLTLVEQILSNLISNAIKYSYAGSQVEINLMVRSQFECAVTVQDIGQGLSSADISQLFRKYTRLSAKPTQSETSTGLGLYSSQKMAESPGGMIEADSFGKGQGARFTLVLPIALSTQDVEHLDSSDAVPG